MTLANRTAIVRRARGVYSRRATVQQTSGRKGCDLPEYLEAHEVQTVLAAAPNPLARLLMLLQWLVGLRVSEALVLQPADLSAGIGPTYDQGPRREERPQPGSCQSIPSCKTP